MAQDLVDINGNMVYPKGTLITQEIIDVIKPVLEAGAHTRELNTNPRLESNGVIQVLDVYVDDIDSNIMRVIGTDLSLDSKFVTISDMIAAYSYMFNLVD